MCPALWLNPWSCDERKYRLRADILPQCKLQLHTMRVVTYMFKHTEGADFSPTQQHFCRFKPCGACQYVLRQVVPGRSKQDGVLGIFTQRQHHFQNTQIYRCTYMVSDNWVVKRLCFVLKEKR